MLFEQGQPHVRLVAYSRFERPTGYSPHSVMNDEVFEGIEGGRGPEYGTKVHDFAEAYARGEDVVPADADGEEDEANVKAFLDSLEGEIHVEEWAYLPLEVGGERVTISGIVDLVHVVDGRVEVIDYKTDRGRHAESEYRTKFVAGSERWFRYLALMKSVFCGGCQPVCCIERVESK